MTDFNQGRSGSDVLKITIAGFRACTIYRIVFEDCEIEDMVIKTAV